MARNRGSWTADSRAYLQNVQKVLTALRTYWPLTLRQVYYQLVAGLLIENEKGAYKKLSRILAKARLDGLVPWEALEDRTRSVLGSDGWTNRETFLEDELDSFLKGYRRDCLRSQAVAPEVWIEKDALSRVCHRAANPYCVPVIVARGFSSVSYINECRRRIQHNAGEGRRTVILYFGDLDPSGWEMLPAMMKTLQEEMNLWDSVEGKRCALTPEQVDQYSLPRSLDAMKNTDSRTPKYRAMLRRGGYADDLAVELDALGPATLEGLVREAIEGQLDLSVFNREKETEEEELETLDELRTIVQDYVEEHL